MDWSGRRRILYVQYTNPAAYPSLEHSARLLAQRGWQVAFLGTEIPGIEALRLAPHPAIIERRLGPRPKGWRGHLHYLWFCLWVLGWVARWRPAWVYASDPLACPAALLVSVVPGARVLYHEHDAPGAALTRSLRGALWARRRLAQRAHLCVVPNAQRLARFAEETARRHELFCVWNCPAREEAARARPSQVEPGLRVLYHGSLVPQRLPLTILQALALLPETVRLRLVGYETVGHLGYTGQVLDAAARLQVGHRVECLGALPARNALLDEGRRNDVGLALMPTRPTDSNLQYMAGASNKPFEYLASGMAVLVSDQPEWRTLYAEPGYGLACDPDDPASIAKALRWFWEHPAETRAMGERGRQRILAEWHYERRFAPVLARLTDTRG